MFLTVYSLIDWLFELIDSLIFLFIYLFII